MSRLINHMSPMLNHAFSPSSPLTVVSNVNHEYLVLITDGVVLFVSFKSSPKTTTDIYIPNSTTDCY